MDGTIALVFLLTGLADMRLNHCATGCLAPEPVTPRLSFQVANLEFQEESIGGEIFADYATGEARGPFQPVVGFSYSSENSAWLGFGLRTAMPLFDTGLVAEGALMPGFHATGDGPYLGGSLQFRSSLGMSYEFINEARVGVYYDHRSNADINRVNPGLETFGFRLSVPLN
ncbi:hypothetical protein OG2516_03123 [Oceanicola granulosus HTCC2516]|uniref:Acyloxyacyl hydrolase n=1 Tax=Oceanicola granulosus (strain ATCC BAA-861 / DSM 15982 / KCTC 12143 / HTCC2516) TaxID=314256 RepID=Q2CEA1_OCEGH|nr:acyloxyacyl hydrolase [Oceanicola granulosus]EAR50959.1 hypothetical protein OG2516_03123 [Oceanicola granulosus HTCC2516]